MRVKPLIFSLLLGVHVFADVPLTPDNSASEVYQYFVPGPQGKNSGAYLWVPPGAPVIRAVMVGIHNGLPVTILQNAAVRRVCNQYGIAQILLTPNGSDIGTGGMLKDPCFDMTEPARTAINDAPKSTRRIKLVVTQVPVKDPKPIKVTVGAYQVGLWQPDGFKAASTVYQSFQLTP